MMVVARHVVKLNVEVCSVSEYHVYDGKSTREMGEAEYIESVKVVSKLPIWLEKTKGNDENLSNFRTCNQQRRE
jgi:hypothetical protein